ncbi:hypothetical protein MHYP_G00250160 [Metynnis hypsauchen]
MYDNRDWKSIDLCFLSILNMFQQHPTGMKTGITTATDQAFLRAPRQPAGRLATEGRLAARSTLRQPKEKPEAAESHPLTTDSSSEGLPAPKLHSRVGKRPKLDINSATSPV